MAVLLVHGGAGAILQEYTEVYEEGLRAALEAGWAALRAEGESESRALGAVLAAVTSMEANPEAFNAGVGGALTREGRVELDACVMVSPRYRGGPRDSGGPCHSGDPRDSGDPRHAGVLPGEARAGAVAGVSNTPHPALLADRVRRESPHVLLIGAGAEALVKEPVSSASLVTERSRRALRRAAARGQGSGEGSNTVGAVALDEQGNLAAATSTGGVTGQWSGRVGDAPLPGLGTYADERIAVSCTGKGEAFMITVAAGTFAASVAQGVPLNEAAATTLKRVREAGGDGGLIAVTRAAGVVVGFSSESMAYGLLVGDPQNEKVVREAKVARGARIVVRGLNGPPQVTEL